jgi:hypothetical protein
LDGEHVGDSIIDNFCCQAWNKAFSAKFAKSMACRGIVKLRRFRSTATAAGVAEFDVKERTLSSFLLVFQGSYQQGAQPETQKGRPFGAVAEWQRTRTPP